jgi:hypothetical protein
MANEWISELASSCWNTRPGAFSGVLRETIWSENEMFRAVVAASDRYRDNHSEAEVRVYLDGSLLPWDKRNEEIAAMLPKQSDGGFDGFEDRMEASLGNRDYTISLPNIHRFDRTLWNRVCRLLDDLYQYVGLPNDWDGWVDSNSFIGRYSRTPFGVHWGPMAVLTFPVIGRKLFRGWDDDYVQKHPDLHDSHEYADHLVTSRVLAGSAGDVIYWPSRFWHIAESDKAFTAAFSIGFWCEQVTANPTHQVLGAARLLLDAKAPEASHRKFETERRPKGDQYRTSARWLEHAARLRTLIEDGKLERALKLIWLRGLSASGFRVVPPLREKISLATVTNTGAIVHKIAPILHCDLASDRLAVACGGYAFEVNGPTSETKAVLDSLECGNDLSLQSLQEAGSKAGIADVDELIGTLLSLGGLNITYQS